MFTPGAQRAIENIRKRALARGYPCKVFEKNNKNRPLFSFGFDEVQPQFAVGMRKTLRQCKGRNFYVIEGELTKAGMDYGIFVADIEIGESRRMECEDAHGYHQPNPVETSRNSACGELFTSIGIQFPWQAEVNSFKAPDVGPYQVRTVTKDYFRLIVRHEDSDDEKFILVVGKRPFFSIRGWILGRDAKVGKPENPDRRDPNRELSWFVDQWRLKDISSL